MLRLAARLDVPTGPPLSFVAWGLVVAVAILAGCKSDPTGVAAAPATLTLNATSVSLSSLGDTLRLQAVVRDQKGGVLPDAAVEWSAAPGPVQLSSSGLITALANGIATVTARSGEAQATAQVTVEQVPHALVKIAGDMQTATAGSTLPIPVTVRALDKNGNPVPDTPVLFHPAPSSGFTQMQGAAQASTVVTTSMQGEASTSWILGTSTAAPQTLYAAIPESNVQGVAFSATALPGAPAAMTLLAGGNQSAMVGSAVPTLPVVEISDPYGNPVPGVGVLFQVTAGGGTVVGGSTSTNVMGRASPTGWFVGTTPGTNALRVTALLVEPVDLSAIAVTGPPADIQLLQGGGQTGATNSPLPVQPEVRVTDQYSNPVSGAAVSFTVTMGGGAIAVQNTNTDDNGIASAGTWTLGPLPGENRLTLTVGSLPPTVLSATAFALPANISIQGGNSQTAVVGSQVVTTPTVLVTDAQLNPVAGVTVTFTAALGGGSVGNSSALTDMNGIATPGTWTLGTVVGINTLQAQVNTLAPVTFTATAIAGAATSIAVNGGDSQSALVNTPVAIAPSVVVLDNFANPVPGVPVTFAVSGGGGSIVGATTTTNGAGVAAVQSWTLGTTPGPNSLTATATGSGINGNPVTFTATGTAVAANFNIELVFLTSISPAQQAVFNSAVNRWQSIITGDLADVAVNFGPGDCGSNSPALNQVVDDLIIYVTVEPIDGVGGVLGSAGPCRVRGSNFLPLTGRMRFDQADMNSMESNGVLEAVILHEMGHVLGIGTLWSWKGFLQNPSLPSSPGVDTHFSGPAAIAAFNSIGGNSYLGAKVPVENSQGGSGTRDSHWRESVMQNELMTGFVSWGFNPLSIVTIRSLQDLGYEVNTAPADPFVLPGGGALMELLPRLHLHNDINPDPIRIGGG